MNKLWPRLEGMKRKGGGQALYRKPECFNLWPGSSVSNNVINKIPSQTLVTPFCVYHSPFQVLAATFFQLGCFGWDFTKINKIIDNNIAAMNC